MARTRPSPWEREGTPERAEAERLADRYVEANLSLRGLASESGKTYGYVYRRVRSFAELRPYGNPQFGEQARKRRENGG